MEKMKTSLCLSMAVIAMLASASLVAPGAEEAQPLTAVIGVVIDITIEGAITWEGVLMNENRRAAPPPRDNYSVWVENTTTVVVDIWARVENIHLGVSRPGMYAAVPGPDNLIENVDWWRNSALTLEETRIGSTTLVRIPWMQNIAVPGATSPRTELNAFPAIDTAVNQVGGTYRGTLTVRAKAHPS
jgi:hypothetical protein